MTSRIRVPNFKALAALVSSRNFETWKVPNFGGFVRSSPVRGALTRKASCRWQTRVTLAKRLHGLCKSSGVVSCVASLPIDSLPMVSYYVTSERRLWKNLDVARFRAALLSSSLCTDDAVRTDSDVDAMASQYDQVITSILDEMIPPVTATYRMCKSDPWYNDECCAAKRSARKLERRYKRALKASMRNCPTASSVDASRESWLQALKTSHRLVEQKRRRFWWSQAVNSTNPARLWQTFDTVMGRSKVPNSTKFSPHDFVSCYARFQLLMRKNQQSAPPPQYSEVNPDVNQLSSFDSVTVAEIMKLIHNAPNKQSWLDPLPMWLLKNSHLWLIHYRIIGQFQIYPFSQSCLNVLSAPSFNHMSVPIFCFHSNNLHIGAVTPLKLHSWKSIPILSVHLTLVLTTNLSLRFLTWLQRLTLLTTVSFCGG